MINDIHSHNENSINSIINLEYNKKNSFSPKKLYSVGYHPWYLKNKVFELNEKYLSENKNIVALGETGLDKTKVIPLNLQKEFFIKHLDLASKTNKPVIIHCVKAFNEIIEIAQEYPKIKLIFHSFIGSYQLATSLINKGWFLSFSKKSLQSDKTIESLKKIPNDVFFIETDNNSFPINDLIKLVAKIRNVDFNDISNSIEYNFLKLFKNG